MKNIILVMSVLVSLKSFASRTDVYSEIIRTDSDAIAANKVSCVNFATKENRYNSADIVAENETCYFRRDDNYTMRAAFLKEMRAYYQVTVTADTIFNKGMSPLYIRGNQLDKILAKALQSLTQTQGCKAVSIIPHWGSKLINSPRYNLVRVREILDRLPETVRCK